jgi:RNA polymerase sigma factor (sigma-70 family)
MPDTTDMELLEAYGQQDSEEAFAELVRRHVDLVYSAALRHVSVPAQAEEITQAVFVILARKAAGLRSNIVLEAWLYETARLTSLSFLRGEHRRRRREQEAYMQSVLNETANEPTWNQLSPLLDDAMARLGKKDRDAVILRFFKGKSLAEIAATLQTTEAAAQSRVHRAVGKLQRFFLKRGIDSTAEAIAGAMSANAVLVAPASLAKTATAIGLAKGMATSTSTTTLIKGALKLMAWTKIKVTVVIGAISLLAIGTTVIATKAFTPASKIVSPVIVASAYPGDWIWKGDSRNLNRVPPLLILQPSKRPTNWVPFGMQGDHRYLAEGKTVKELLAAVYSQIDSAAKLDFQVELPADRWDCIDTLPGTNWWWSLRDELNKRFNIVEEFDVDAGGNRVVLVRTATSVFATKAFASESKTATGVYPGDWIWRGDSLTLDRVPPLLILQPSKLPPNWVPFDMQGDRRYLAEGKTVKELLAAVYSQIDSRAKLDFQIQLPSDKWDCIDTLQDTNWCYSLQKELNARFHITEEFSTAPGPNRVVIVKAEP